MLYVTVEDCVEKLVLVGRILSVNVDEVVGATDASVDVVVESWFTLNHSQVGITINPYRGAELNNDT